MSVSARLKVGDTVLVRSGKDRGKTGAILDISRGGKVSTATVAGVNLLTHFVKKTEKSAGGLEKKEAAKPLSTLALLCPLCQKPTRVGFSNEGGKKMRECKRCGKSF
jgi:large subunit ribosomal protein L24